MKFKDLVFFLMMPCQQHPTSLPGTKSLLFIVLSEVSLQKTSDSSYGRSLLYNLKKCTGLLNIGISQALVNRQKVEYRMRIRYHKLTKDDLQILTSLIRLYEEVFNMQHFIMPPADYLQSLLQKEHILFYTALAGKEVVGGLTAYVLPSVYFSAAEVYIYDLAVKTEHQRKGIGSQLINELKEHCRQLGHKEIFVQADIDDQHALDFYQATGGQPESVIHYSYGLT